MTITQENAEKYDKQLLFAPNGLFHYYPLKVVKGKDGYIVVDRDFTRMKIPTEKDGGIFFEYALTEEQYYRVVDATPDLAF